MSTKRRNDMVGGLLLIGIGAVVLAGQFINFEAIPNFGFMVLPAIGLLFMLSGIFTRSEGLMIPGGIIGGVGLGAYLVGGPFTWESDLQQGGVFLLAFALGWVSITVLSALFAKKTAWFALIPAAILAAVGGMLYLGGVYMDLLEVVGKLWPLALVAAGVAIIFKAARHSDDVKKVKA